MCTFLFPNFVSLVFLLALLSNVSQSVICDGPADPSNPSDSCTAHAANNLLQNPKFIGCKEWSEIKRLIHSSVYFDGAKTLLQKAGYVFDRNYLEIQEWIDVLKDAATNKEYEVAAEKKLYEITSKFVGFWISVTNKNGERHQTALASMNTMGDAWYLDSNDCGANKDGGDPHTGYSRAITKNQLTIIRFMAQFVVNKHHGQYKAVNWIEAVTLNDHLYQEFVAKHQKTAKPKELPTKEDDPTEDIEDFLFGAETEAKKIAPRISEDIELKKKKKAFSSMSDVVGFMEDEIKQEPVQKQLKSHHVPIEESMQSIFGVVHEPHGVKKTIVADGGGHCDAFCESEVGTVSCTIVTGCIHNTVNPKTWCHSKSTDVVSVEEKHSIFAVQCLPDTEYDCVYQVNCQQSEDVTIYDPYNQYYKPYHNYWTLTYALIEVDVLIIFLLCCCVICIGGILFGALCGYIFKYNLQETTLIK